MNDKIGIPVESSHSSSAAFTARDNNTVIETTASRKDEAGASLTLTSVETLSSAQASPKNEEEVEEMFDFMDEDREQRLIEERRKKRQAILAKYQNDAVEETISSKGSPIRKTSISDESAGQNVAEDGILI
jgi:hypothetical protein